MHIQSDFIDRNNSFLSRYHNNRELMMSAIQKKVPRNGGITDWFNRTAYYALYGTSVGFAAQSGCFCVGFHVSGAY